MSFEGLKPKLAGSLQDSRDREHGYSSRGDDSGDEPDQEPYPGITPEGSQRWQDWEVRHGYIKPLEPTSK